MLKGILPHTMTRRPVQHGKGRKGQERATVFGRKTTKKTVEPRLDQSKKSQDEKSILGRKVKWVEVAGSRLKIAGSYLKIGFYNILLKLSEDEKEIDELKKCIKDERKYIDKLNGKEAREDFVENIKKGNFKEAGKNGADAIKSAFKVVTA